MARTLLLIAALLACASDAPADDEDTAGEIVRTGDVTALDDQPDSPLKKIENVQPTSDFDFAFAGGIEEGPKPKEPVKLNHKARPLAAKKSDKTATAKSSLSKPIDSLITIGGSLCVVLSLFFGLAWLTRRGMPKPLGKLPGEVIEVLGKRPLVKGQELQLVRVGAKLLLICVTPNGCETLTEITDQSEVDRLASICRSSGPTSMTAAFNQVLAGVGREPAAGFTGNVRTPGQRGGRVHA
jgi:flagellar biogenesis protein FliO